MTPPQPGIFWLFTHVSYCYAKTLVPLIILTCNTFYRINIQPTINLISPAHIGVNTTSFFSHLFSFKGTLLTHCNFLLQSVEVTPFGSITWYFISAFPSHLDMSVCLGWLTASGPSSPKPRYNTMVDSLTEHKCVTQTRCFHSSVDHH